MNIIKSCVLSIIGCILLFASCQSIRTIVHGVNEREANEILVILARANIAAHKVQEVSGTTGGGPKIVLWDIVVNPTDTLQAMAVLSANGLPRSHSQNLLDLFTNQGLVPSDTSEKIRYEAGLANSIANTIRKIDGVVDADVVLSFPQENPLNPLAKAPPITASIYVKTSGNLDDPANVSTFVSKIKRLASSAISGLSYDNVTVVTDKSRFFVPVTNFEPSAPKEYVHVWGFDIAQSSLSAFQFLFAALIVCMLIFCSLTILFLWKLHPLLNRRGGMKLLFMLRPIPDELPQPKTEEKPEVAGAEKGDKESKKRVQENIEE